MPNQSVTIPTEPIGSIPRPLELIEAIAAMRRRHRPGLDPLYDEADPRHHRAVRGHRLAGHHRRRAAEVPQLLDLQRPGPAEHRARRLQDPVRRRPRPPHAAAHRRAVPLPAATRTPTWTVALRYAHVPVKQAVISPSALSLMYPADEIPGYPREQFIDDLLREHETEVRRCLQKGAHKVQIDFTEGRLAVKIDPSGELLAQLHRPEQPRAGAVLGRGAHAHRRAHLPRRRPRLDPQRRRRLRRAAAQPVRAQGRQLLRRAGRRAGPRRACSRSSAST